MVENQSQKIGGTGESESRRKSSVPVGVVLMTGDMKNATLSPTLKQNINLDSSHSLAALNRHERGGNQLARDDAAGSAEDI